MTLLRARRLPRTRASSYAPGSLSTGGYRLLLASRNGLFRKSGERLAFAS